MIKKFVNRNKPLIKCSREVLKAIDNKIPLVALESSIISHGMPYPQSLEMAKDIEEMENLGIIECDDDFDIRSLCEKLLANTVIERYDIRTIIKG